MTNQHLLVEQDGRVSTIILNRPQVLNALNAAMLDELDAALSALEASPGTGAIVLTGAGDRAFSAGADLAELVGDAPADAYRRARRTQAIYAKLERLGIPVVAAINGLALGGGCELAMSCTIRVAASHATFGQPEINLGLMPGYGASARLPRLIGRGRALEWLLTGQAVTADEACRAGLVNRVVPAGDLRSAVRDLARELASKPRRAVQHILDAVAAGLSMPPEAAAEHEAALFGLTCATDDMREGAQAFLEKRRPVFSGR